MVTRPWRLQKGAPLCVAQACAKYVARATEEMGAINIYEIYADVCRDWRADADGRQLLRALAGPDALLRRGEERALPVVLAQSVGLCVKGGMGLMPRRAACPEACKDVHRPCSCCGCFGEHHVSLFNPSSLCCDRANMSTPIVIAHHSAWSQLACPWAQASTTRA